MTDSAWLFVPPICKAGAGAGAGCKIVVLPGGCDAFVDPPPGGGSDDVQLAPILPTSCAYAAFMGASSNTRYQLVNTFEALALPAFPAPTRNVVSAAVRTGNNFIGSSNWIWWAKRCGLQ